MVFRSANPLSLVIPTTSVCIPERWDDPLAMLQARDQSLCQRHANQQGSVASDRLPPNPKPPPRLIKTYTKAVGERVSDLSPYYTDQHNIEPVHPWNVATRA